MTIAPRLKNARSLAPVLLSVLLVPVAFQGCKLVTYDAKVTSVTVTPATPTIAGITTKQFTATATYSDTSTKDVTAEAAWTSLDPSIATVSGGLATPATPPQAGVTTITATLGGVSGSATLTVTNAQLQSIDVTPGNPSIANGTSIQFTATGHFDDSSTQNLTSQVSWDADSSVTISNAAGSQGLATSTVRGAASSTITATLGAISGFTTLTVNDVTLTSLAVTPATATIKVGFTQQFTATGTFSDFSTQDMTREVSWASSATNIATIGSSTGLARGVFAGSTTITATSSALLGSVSGTAQLTVQTSGGGY